MHYMSTYHFHLFTDLHVASLWLCHTRVKIRQQLRWLLTDCTEFFIFAVIFLSSCDDQLVNWYETINFLTKTLDCEATAQVVLWEATCLQTIAVGLGLTSTTLGQIGKGLQIAAI